LATYLVTGASGFIGSNLVEHLLNTNQSVVAMDNFSTGKKTNLEFTLTHPNSGHFRFINGDIRNLDDCINASKNVDYILHQAALGSVPKSIEEPTLYNDNNVGGTVNIFEAARLNKVRAVVYASSSSVYGDSPTLPKIETMTVTPKSPYALSKLTTELYGKLYWDLYQLPTVGLRYFNVFGPKQDPSSQYAAVIPNFIAQFLKNQAPTIYGDGEQTRDFIYIKNVIDANLAACTAPTKAFGEAYNIGTGKQISINTLAKKIKATTHTEIEIKYDASRKGDVRYSLANIEKAQKLLGLKARISLDDGLNTTIKWFQRQLN
jgi:nucleoside-diphosphate-sugar epimerase